MNNRQFYRSGPVTGHEQHHTFADLRRRFDFRSIRVGRWVTEAERDRACGLFYDALVDLMAILSGPEILISLRGNLSFQYGMGGRPGVAAHYDPSQRCFSLAKNAGPGSIAHEWFHALDHYLVDKTFSDASPGMFASKAWLEDATPIVHPLNDLLHRCFKTILLSEDGNQPSELFNASVKADQALQTNYYSRPEEVCARAFEAFVQDAPIRNNFLVAGSKASAEAERGLYPLGEQRLRINQAFSDYFSALGRALNS